MRKNNLIFKVLFSLLLVCCLYSEWFAAPSQKWREIINDLTSEWRTDDEIKIMMEDLWYNTSDYFSSSSTSNKTYTSTQSKTTAEWRNVLNKLRNEWRTDDEIKSKMERAWLDTSWYFPETNTSTNYNTTSYNSGKTTPEWRNILNKLRNEWRTDDEIKSKMEKAWLDTSWYFPSSSGSSKTSSSSKNKFLYTYTSRSCKNYDIEYLSELWIYSSPNLLKTEYFVNAEYFKRYIDSKNPQRNGCPTNVWRISNSYIDSSNSIYRYTAPNWKVYFITNQNWSYTSKELSKVKYFWTINELKSYIRDRNPLIWMWNNESQTSNWLVNEKKDQELNDSDEAKKNRDIARKNDLSQIQTAIITSRIDNDKTWPGNKNNNATEWLTMAEIAKDLEVAGLTYVPFDPISSNTVRWLWSIKWIWEYIYIVTKSNWVKNAWFALMAKPETKEGANRIVCDWEKDFDNGYITNSTDIKDIQYCTTFIKTDYCKRDNQGRSKTQKCYYSNESQLRYLLTY